MERGKWHPELVGTGIRGYPKTQEAFDKIQARCRAQVIALNAAGKCNRKGIPDGWAGRRAEVDAIRAQAALEAKEIVQTMAKEGLIDKEDPRGEEALEFSISVVRAVDADGNGTYQMRERLQAAKMVLEYTKQKPASKVEATVSKAEDFLALLAAK
jgi:hypothetical protein